MDRRSEKTREALISAFNQLVLETDEGKIRLADIVERAHVGRSTFYEHYAGADDIHMQALARPFSVLADALAGRCNASDLAKLLEHFWHNRPRAQNTLGDPPTRAQMAKLLVGQLDERIEGELKDDTASRELALRQIAEAGLSLISGWVCLDFRCSAEELSATVCRSASVLRRGFFED